MTAPSRTHLFFHLSIGPVDAWRLILNLARFPAPLIEWDGPPANDNRGDQ